MNYLEECLYHCQRLQELLGREQELFGQTQRFEGDKKYRIMLETEEKKVNEMKQQLRQMNYQ